MPDLVLRPSGLPERVGRPWALQLRDHGPAETAYATLARVSDDTAREIAAAGAPRWLFGEPDWSARSDAQDLERARALREQADAMERDVRGLPRREEEIAAEHCARIGYVAALDALPRAIVLSLAREVARLEAGIAAVPWLERPAAQRAIGADALSRRVEVENALLEASAGKRPLPDADTCKALALRLGVPSEGTPLRVGETWKPS